jgi:poly(3-hydroxybutyrate) depolymerase
VYTLPVKPLLALVLAACAAAPDDGASEDPGVAGVRRGAEPLGRYGAIEPSASGLSSGGYFAVQLAVAFSSRIVGVGAIAGGPYDCGGEHPFWDCMYQGHPDPGPAIERTRRWSGVSIDPIAGLARQRVYLLSGTLDAGRPVMDALFDYEAAFVAPGNIVYDRDRPFAHTFPTDAAVLGDNPCWAAVPPYISDCGFDAAGAILAHIYGPLRPRNDGALGGRMVRFDQTEFVAGAARHGLDATGWLYVPASCAAGARCRLHVVLHGCTQNQATIGRRFVDDTGYPRWADTNELLVLYPQTIADWVDHDPPSGAGANIDACWDWVGYYGADFDQRSGVQLAAVKRMIDRLGGDP